MHIQFYFITNSLFRHQKLASNLHFLRLAQLFFLFETYSVSFLQKAYFYAKNFDYPEKTLKYKHIRRISD